jgi:tetratricopeptide (TPR) repeat protein
MDALRELMSGNFSEAVNGFEQELRLGPDDISSVDGLSAAYQGIGDYEKALPLMGRVHAYQKAGNPDAPGQLLAMACAYWCLSDRNKALGLVHELCASMLDGSVSMAPDQAGGATFGLVLHYMAETAKDGANRDYALDYLRKLNAKYDKRPTLFRYPVQTVKQVLGELSFEGALEGATKARSLPAAYQAAKSSRLALGELGIALFHDGALYRASGDEAGCMERMQRVFDLGYQTESIRWQLARHEVLRKTR